MNPSPGTTDDLVIAGKLDEANHPGPLIAGAVSMLPTLWKHPELR